MAMKAGRPMRADLAERLNRYAKLRDQGMRPVDAGLEIGVSEGQAPRL